MDPFTITSSVLRITGSFIGAAHTLWEIRNAWKLAPVTVSTLCSHLKLTAASLSQIQALLLNETDAMLNKPDLRETFDTTLTSCLVLSKLLESYVQKIKKGTLEGNKATWKMKFKTIWNENEVNALLKQLTTQQDAVNLLVNLLQIDSISDIKKRVRRNEKLLRKIAENTRYLRRSHGVEAPASILGTDEASESIFSQLIDPKDCGEVGFETVILSTKVYSNAFTGVLSPVTNDGESDEARTVLGSETVDLPLRPVTTAEVDDRATSNITEVTIGASELRRSVPNLEVADIIASSQVDYTAELDHEHSLKRHDEIFDVQRFSRSRYGGWIRKNPEDTPGMWGQFDREKVVLGFKLCHPLKVRTVEAFSSQLYNRVSYSKGEIFTSKYIRHGCMWHVKYHTHDDSNRSSFAWVYICDLEVVEASEKDVDHLLEFSSCPISEFMSLSKDELRHELRKRVHQDMPLRELHALLVHCSSLKELQYVSSLFKHG